MDRIRLVEIDYSDWRRGDSRPEQSEPKEEADGDLTLWPDILYALDDKGRCLTAAHFAGALRVVASTPTAVSTVLDIASAAEQLEDETDAKDWLFPNDRFDKSLLSSDKRCSCGCALVDGRFRTVCLRCKLTEAPCARVTTIRCGTETKSNVMVNVGGKRIDLPAGYRLLWQILDSSGGSILIVHYEGMDILARPTRNAGNNENFIAISWSLSGYGGEYLLENSDLVLEEFAVRLGCLSQWRVRLEFNHLRCNACFRLRHDQFGPCCHCGHAPEEKPVRKNFLPAGKKIRVVHIGESQHLSMWFRELIGVDGKVYRLYHRGGNMYAFRVEDEFILFDRKQGGPFDGAGNNSEILQQTSDVFELVDRGTKCWFCATIYPDGQVPSTCYVCDLPVTI